MIHKTQQLFHPEAGIKIKNGGKFTLFVSGSLLPMALDIVEVLSKNAEGTLISLPVIKPINKK